MNRLILLGAGKCGREVLQLALDINKIEKRWGFFGFLDYTDAGLEDKECIAKVIGTDDNYSIQENDHFICTIGDGCLREKIMKKMEDKGAKFVNLIHPTAVIADSAHLSEGIIVYPYTVITTDTHIGKGCIINMNCTIAHDVVIKDYCTISPGCNITGGCSIGSNVFLGVGANIIPNVKIGDRAMICAGSVVMTNVKADRKTMGNPAKVYTPW